MGFDRIMEMLPLRGDVAQMPDAPVAELGEHAAIAGVLGWILKREGKWAGVSVMHIALFLHQVDRSQPVQPPKMWFEANGENRIVQEVQAAAAEGWLSYCDGYIYPTQALADVLLGA